MSEDGDSADLDKDMEIVRLPIDGVLDLHSFQPKEIKPLLHDYIEACLERNILEVRFIHGKGTGQLRRTVRAILEKHPAVLTLGDASLLYGGYGATVCHLRQRED
jgi:DNA-nicking Smr family endonuclease